MLDLKLIRERPDQVRAALARRGRDYPIDEVLERDARRRKIQTELDSLRAEQKKVSGEIGRAPKELRQNLLTSARMLSEDIKRREREEDALATELRSLLLEIPNLPHPSAAEGTTEDASIEMRRWGAPPAFAFGVRDHVEIGTALNILDIDRASKASGARFAYLKGKGALLELALVRFVVDRLAANGFTPVIPPVLVRREAMEGTGFLPTDEQQIYKVETDDLYLVGTAEVPLAAMHSQEFLEASALPLRYAGFSTCFRREAGTYGKDTRGIIRVHQFDKVEMFSYATPETSWEEFEFLVSMQEGVLQALGIPYRAVNIPAGDLGAPAAKKVDLEAWMPGQNAYREVTSCSNCTDYQARRLNCRMRTERGTAFVHTLNGTGVAVGRMLVAIFENYQQADGTIRVPEVLVPHAGFDSISA